MWAARGGRGGFGPPDSGAGGLCASMPVMPAARSSEPRQDLVIHAVGEPRGIWLGTIVTLPGFILLALGITSSAPAAVLMGTAFFAVVLAFSRWSMRHLTTRHLTVRGGQLTLTTMYRTRVISPGRPIARAVRAEYISDRLTENVAKVLLLIDGSGRMAFRIFPAAWHAEVDRLPAALGLTEEVRAGQTTARQLRREYPGAVPWGEAHIVMSTLLFLAVACVLVAGVQAVV